MGQSFQEIGIKGDKTENLIHRIGELVIPQHVRKVIVICGINTRNCDKPSDIAKALILCCNLDVIKTKTNQNNSPCHSGICYSFCLPGLFLGPKNKGNSFGRQKLLQTNSMLKEKCSQVPNVAYLQPDSDWVTTNTELELYTVISMGFML